AEHLVVGDANVDKRLLTVSVRDTDLRLTAAEFRILSELIAARGLVVPSGRLATISRTRPEGRGVAVHISRIRRKLADASASLVTIETARGFGYRCVQTTAPAAA